MTWDMKAWVDPILSASSADFIRPDRHRLQRALTARSLFLVISSLMMCDLHPTVQHGFSAPFLV